MLKRVFIVFGLVILITGCDNKTSSEVNINEVHAILIPESGTYSRKISTENKAAQAFF